MTAVAVVFGLALVIWELQQTRALTQAQIIQDRWIEINEGNYALYGEEGAATVAAACVGAKLSPEQQVILKSYFHTAMNRGLSAKRLLDATGIDNGWKRILGLSMNVVAGFPDGAEWLQSYGSSDPEIRAFIAAKLESLRPVPCPVAISAEHDRRVDFDG